MDTIWTWTWGWCLIPLLFFAIMVVACVAMLGRGGCGCVGGRGGQTRNPPDSPAQ